MASAKLPHSKTRRIFFPRRDQRGIDLMQAVTCRALKRVTA